MFLSIKLRTEYIYHEILTQHTKAIFRCIILLGETVTVCKYNFPAKHINGCTNSKIRVFVIFNRLLTAVDSIN